MFHAYRLFTPRRPRHGLLRVLGGLIGVALLGGMLLFGVVALVAIAVIGGVVWLVRQLQATARPESVSAPNAAPTPMGVIEGEFVVVRDGARMPQA